MLLLGHVPHKQAISNRKQCEHICIDTVHLCTPYTDILVYMIIGCLFYMDFHFKLDMEGMVLKFRLRNNIVAECFSSLWSWVH
jgi:ABC-type siderophore export system fused ATPase/permease subunit